MPDLETGDMIGLMSSIGPGLMTEIKKDPRQLLLPEVEREIHQIDGWFNSHPTEQ